MKSYPRIICLGEILWDCLADVAGQSMEKVQSWTAYPGGAPANVACGVTKLGTPAAFVGCVGQDELGFGLVKKLQSHGVDCTGIQYHPSAPTRQVYVLRDLQGERYFAGFGHLPSDSFADAFLQPRDLPENLFLHADFFVLGTLELAYPSSRAAIFRALQLAELYNLSIIVDINWRSMFWPDESIAKPFIKNLLKFVDFIKLSKEEALWLFDKTDAGAIVHSQGNLEGAMVTDGSNEVSYCLSNNEGKFTPISVNVQDTTGAGDAFLAGFIHQLAIHSLSSLKNPDVARDIITYACGVGSLSTTKFGAISSLPTPEEVEFFLSKN